MASSYPSSISTRKMHLHWPLHLHPETVVASPETRRRQQACASTGLTGYKHVFVLLLIVHKGGGLVVAHPNYCTPTAGESGVGRACNKPSSYNKRSRPLQVQAPRP